VFILSPENIGFTLHTLIRHISVHNVPHLQYRKISGSSADPFAALVISTPVSNFILNSETTCSYLFILLKISIGAHLELLKLIQYTSAVCNILFHTAFYLTTRKNYIRCNLLAISRAAAVVLAAAVLFTVAVVSLADVFYRC
jgi:hypothetical protein